MPANLENSAVATGLETVSFHSNPKQRQCQRRFKRLHNCTHLTHQQSNAQNSPSQASTVHKPCTSRCSSWIQKRQRNQTSNCQHLVRSSKKQESYRKTSTPALLTTQKPLTVWITTNYGKFLKRWEYQIIIPEKPVCKSRSNSYNQTWNNGLFQNWERSTPRLQIDATE